MDQILTFIQTRPGVSALMLFCSVLAVGYGLLWLVVGKSFTYPFRNHKG